MFPLLLGLALAQDADLDARLLGPEPAPVSAAEPSAASTPVATPSASSLEMPPWWTLPLLGLALGYAWTQRKKTEQVEADALRVLGRTPLGKDASVVLLEVRDAQGAWRRLLVGHGGDGPQLITGLGSSQGQVPVAQATPFASMIDEAARLDALPEVPAYPVVPPPAPEPSTMVTSWNRAEEPEPKPDADKAEAPKPADPAVDKAEADKAQKPVPEKAVAEEEAPTPAPKARKRFTLQVGSFQDKSEADSFFRQLEASKHKPFMVAAEVPGKGQYYRIRVGAYASYEEAIAAKERFEDKEHVIAYVTRLK